MVNLVAMPVSRGTMEKYQNRHVRLVEHAAKQWGAMANKVTNNNNRRKRLERQSNTIYRNVYDRIREEVSEYKIPFGSLDRLKTRQEKLNLFPSGNVSGLLRRF